MAQARNKAKRASPAESQERKEAHRQARSIQPDAYEPDARSRALLRGVEIAEQDLRSAGGAYELDEVRRLMGGVSRQAIEKRVRQGSLLAVPGPSGRRRYPAIQFMPDGSVVDGLRSVRSAMPSSNPWLMLNFLTNPDPRLDERRPIDLLKAGEVGPVCDAALRLAEQGS